MHHLEQTLSSAVMARFRAFKTTSALFLETSSSSGRAA